MSTRSYTRPNTAPSFTGCDGPDALAGLEMLLAQLTMGVT